MKIHLKYHDNESLELNVPAGKTLEILVDNDQVDIEDVKEIIIKLDPADSCQIQKDTGISESKKGDREDVDEKGDKIVEKMTRFELESELGHLAREYDIKLEWDGSVIYTDSMPENIVDRFDLLRDELDYRNWKKNKP